MMNVLRMNKDIYHMTKAEYDAEMRKADIIIKLSIIIAYTGVAALGVLALFSVVL